jgi:hypothetical protein
MDKELEQYYNTYFDLFSSAGWQQYVQDVRDNRAMMSDVLTVRDGDDLFYRKGVLETLDRILNFESAIEAAHELHSNDKAEGLGG